MVFLIGKIGEKKAGQLLLGAEIISAHDAVQFGLVNAIFEKSEIENSVSAFAQKLIKQNFYIYHGF